MSKQPGVHYPKGIPDVVHNRERRLKQNITIPKDDYEESTMSDIAKPVVPNSRITDADKTNDIKSLERKLARTLYLLTKDEKLGWKLPSFALIPESPLHQVAEAGVKNLNDSKINAWTVARSPAAVIKYKSGQIVDSSEDTDGLVREYVIKSNIISGAFEQKNIEFAWLTREEIENLVSKEYFKASEFLFSYV